MDPADRFRPKTVVAQDLEFNLVEAGPEDGPPVFLLHGFPEFWYGWRFQIQPLAKAGLRVIAPDQRGYNRSAKPAGIGSYTVPGLAGDILAIAEALGIRSFSVAGHDWGAFIAWWLAITAPDRVQRLVILNVPHPAVVWRVVRRQPRQILMSWYVGFVQIPLLPEFMLKAGNYFPLVASMVRSSRPKTFSKQNLDRYRRAWSRPGALRAMLHWYRALLWHRLPDPPDARVRVPVRILWGLNDLFLVPENARASLEMCDQADLKWFEEATHWLHLEEPVRVAEEMIDHFST